MKNRIKSQIQREKENIKKQREYLAQQKINVETKILASTTNINRLERQLSNLQN